MCVCVSYLQTPALVDVILAHVAIFTDGISCTTHTHGEQSLSATLFFISTDDPGLESMYRERWYPDHELDFVMVSHVTCV